MDLEAELFNQFLLCFGGLAAVCAGVYWYANRGSKEFKAGDAEATKEFKTFQRGYLLVYYIVMISDWLQGPYVYALYTDYGFDKAAIGQLFIAGFSSSMIFGTFAGGIADKVGRKKMAVAFGIFYSLACVTKLVNDYWILMVGRLLSGVATSLLFSVFEAWMVSEHKARQFDESLLSDTFSKATFGNGLVAIIAGVIASFAARQYGFVSPFMISMGFLIASAVVISSTWTENYGNSKIEVVQTFVDGAKAVANDRRVWLLGTVQSLFEGSMYTFVFMWTPVLSAQVSDGVALPFGMIFAVFMICVMVGSTFFSLAMASGWTPISLGRYVLLLAAAALSAPLWTEDFWVLAGAFFVFELSCGLYFPCFGVLRGQLVPEDQRSSVTSFFRVPLNLLVVGVLLNVGTMQMTTVFTFILGWLLLAAVLHVYLEGLVSSKE